MQESKIARFQEREYYSLRSILGNNWAIFYILLGSREGGKSYSVLDYFLSRWKRTGNPFFWLRLSDVSVKKMLAHDGQGMVDPDLARKYDLDLKVKGPYVYDHGKQMATVLSLSSMAKDKGVALFDKDFLTNNPTWYYHIAIDEFQREKGEKNYFDIVYNLVNQLENIARSTKERIRVFFMANALDEASDVLTAFNFIPEEWGRYYIRKKRCVIDYMPPTLAYLRRRRGSISDILLPDASTFTNTINVDSSRIYKGRMYKPYTIIKFGKEKSTWFTVWDSRTICQYNGETVNFVIAMRPYLGEVFEAEQRDSVYAMWDARYLWFRNLVTQKLFQKQLEILKPTK